MTVDSPEVQRVLAGLAAKLNLPSKSDAFKVLKAAATALGCSVQKDGTTASSACGSGCKGDHHHHHEPSSSKRKRVDDDVKPEEEGSSEDEDSSSGDEEEEEMFEPEMLETVDERKAKEVPRAQMIEDGEELMAWMVAPTPLVEFFGGTWEHRILHISRPKNRTYFDGWLSKKDIDAMLNDGLQYGLQVDVVKVVDGKRINFNYNKDPETVGEIADPAVVKRRLEKEGCSVRLLHPQRTQDPIWRMLSLLESTLGCCTGCNAYLTPAGTQGFAPHYDDIDAFILQVEGSKRWQLFAPVTPEGQLARYPSDDFELEELGEPAFEVVLHPGDLLYMPRGTIHRGVAMPDSHSLHLTVSANQNRTWADFLQAAIPRAVDLTAEDTVVLRRGMPADYYKYCGVVAADSEDDAILSERASFMQHTDNLLKRCMEQFPMDSVADRLACQFLEQRLPPAILAGRPAPKGDLTMKSTVRMVLEGVARLTVEDEQLKVTHCLRNSRSQHAAGSDDEVEAEKGVLLFQMDDAMVLEALLSQCTGPVPVALKDIDAGEDLSGTVDVLGIANRLYAEGLIVQA